MQYQANSAEAMTAGLVKIAPADLSRVFTFEKDAGWISASDTPRLAARFAEALWRLGLTPL